MTPSPSSFPLLRGLRTVCGVCITLLGGAALAAWAVGDPVLARLHAQFDPLHYNAALALVIWGCGLTATSFGCPRTARAAGGMLIGTGLRRPHR